jgi:hypothetical protein
MSGADRQQAYRARQKAAGRESLHTWLEPSTHAQLARLCAELDTDRSGIITRAIRLLHAQQPELTGQAPQHRRRRQAYAVG